MFNLNPSKTHRTKQAKRGFTLEEVVIAMSLTALCFVGTIQGYILASNRAEWAACSIAAQSVACQRMEQVRSARWDNAAYPTIDELTSTNFPMVVHTFDMPLTGTNTVSGAVSTTISSITTDPPLRMIQVDCVWTNHAGRPFTNRVVSYRAANQ